VDPIGKFAGGMQKWARAKGSFQRGAGTRKGRGSGNLSPLSSTLNTSSAENTIRGEKNDGEMGSQRTIGKNESDGLIGKRGDRERQA